MSSCWVLFKSLPVWFLMLTAQNSKPPCMHVKGFLTMNRTEVRRRTGMETALKDTLGWLESISAYENVWCQLMLMHGQQAVCDLPPFSICTLVPSVGTVLYQAGWGLVKREALVSLWGKYRRVSSFAFFCTFLTRMLKLPQFLGEFHQPSNAPGNVMV